MSNTSRFVTLHKYVPDRALQPDDLVIEHRPNPSIQAGQVLLQPIAFSVDPVTQNRLTGRPGFLPQIALGAPIDGPAVGRVTDSRHPDHSVGDLVVGLMDWASYSVWHPSDDDFLGLSKIDERLGKPSHMLGVYGINGLTAYFGIIEVGDVQPGEAVLISSAAGGVGAIAGQIAKIRGAKVFGLTSTQAKQDIVMGRLGFDGVLDYRADNFADQLLAMLPHGPDVYFDNVGGKLSQVVMGQMRRPARIVECGQIATYNDPDTAWKVDISPIHANGLRFDGFSVALFLHRAAEARTKLRGWVEGGQLDPLEHELRGLEQLPGAIAGLFSGSNTGKLIVTIE